MGIGARASKRAHATPARKARGCSKDKLTGTYNTAASRQALQVAISAGRVRSIGRARRWPDAEHQAPL